MSQIITLLQLCRGNRIERFFLNDSSTPSCSFFCHVTPIDGKRCKRFKRRNDSDRKICEKMIDFRGKKNMLPRKKIDVYVNSIPLMLQQDAEQKMYKMPRRESKVHPSHIRIDTMPSQNKRCSFTSWIRSNIKKKQCCFYVEDPSEGTCTCGSPKNVHIEEAIKPEDYMGQVHYIQKQMKEVPTDAFGDISFGGIGQKPGKYVRVSSGTSVEDLYELITKQWQLQPPNLLISVTGGAKNFHMKTVLRNKFRRGLIKVAQTTGAWILTGGTHAGVMKHVGRAVRDYNLSSNAVGSQIVAIGMATWGVIRNRQSLVNSNGNFPAHYYLDEQDQDKLTCLDVNHSHFLLVDDGTSGKYGAEIELRGRLEKLISEQPLENSESELKIPVVCVVLDGGTGTLDTIYNAMINSTPCVVLEGSGRLADVIANVAGRSSSVVTIQDIEQLMEKFFAESFSQAEVAEWTNKIKKIIEMPRLLTVFRIDENNDVDVAILQAFLKGAVFATPFINWKYLEILERHR